MITVLIFAGIMVWPELCLAFMLGAAGYPVLSVYAFFWAFVRICSDNRTRVVERVVEKVRVVRVPVPRKLTRDEAWAILGLTPQAPREAVLASHRNLIARVHPDRGGTNYLAQQVNDARQVLLG